MAYEDPPCLAGHTHTLTHTQSKSLGYEDINGISGHYKFRNIPEEQRLCELCDLLEVEKNLIFFYTVPSMMN